GYSQVLWIDGVERKYVEEAGGMNVMFRIDGKMVTPQLNGSVLPGITRKSAIEIFNDWGDEVEERLLPVDELITAIKEGRVSDAFMIGTAAVICPISGVAYGDNLYEIENGETAQKIYDAITDIQWGRAEDKYGWCVKVG
ncbi:MAG: aminotransferase class IV, partial [Anaerovoracaceae bacterium]|nr:aminotransferase class IV [Anaerovoracaceae bacterium]